MVEEMVRCGVELFCLAPGSRSTPLVTAAASHSGARTLVHFDERGTAFAALGYARATGRPAAWITTSGTAVANGMPAIVEAATDAVPMLALTADRPPELRDAGANQTIEQPGIFGPYARWSFDLPAPDTSVDPAMLLTTADQAVHRTLTAPKGPVHLNCAFREPLAPEDDGEDYAAYLAPLERWRQSGEPYTRYSGTEPAPDSEEVEGIYDRLRNAEHPLVIAGRLGSRKQGEAVVRMAEALGWPLLPDIGSQIRLGRHSGSLIPYHDALLVSEEFTGSHLPDAVLQIGGRPVSKRLANFLSAACPDTHVLADETPFRLDPAHQITHRIQGDVIKLCNYVSELAEDLPPPAEGWLSGWREASEKVEASLSKRTAAAEEIGEPFVARLVSENIPEGYGLVVASSMPVRDLDTYASTDGAYVPVASNRGASGIDGTVATAAGLSRGLQAPVTLLVGDLALLHGINSLAMLRDLAVTVVVLNNDGGGIFNFLPVAEHGEFFEPYFGTPHGLSFETAAGMFGLSYEAPGTLPEFVEVYREACGSGDSTLIEVKTDRDENTALHWGLLTGISTEIS